MILIVWTSAILLPVTWVGRLAPGLRHQLGPLVRPLISPEWVRIMAHTALFAGLVLLLAYALRLPRSWVSLLFLLTVVIGVGLGQEALQLVTKRRSPGWAEVFDLGVDLFGGMLGLMMWEVITRLNWSRVRV